MANCHRCAGPITSGSRTGLCRTCSNNCPELNAKRAEARRRAFALHPEYRKRQRDAVAAANRREERRRQSGEQAKALRLWEHGLPCMTQEVRRRQGQTNTAKKFSDIPLAYWDDYRILVKKIGAAEARKAIFDLAAKALERAHK